MLTFRSVHVAIESAKASLTRAGNYVTGSGFVGSPEGGRSKTRLLGGNWIILFHYGRNLWSLARVYLSIQRGNIQPHLVFCHNPPWSAFYETILVLFNLNIFVCAPDPDFLSKMAASNLMLFASLANFWLQTTDILSRTWPTGGYVLTKVGFHAPCSSACYHG